MQHHCLTCNTTTPHHHRNESSSRRGIRHIAGSERFECIACGRTTFAHDTGSEAFPFALDGQAQRTIAA